jgi:hypothetical protein
LSSADGLVVQTDDGNEFQVAVVQTRYARQSPRRCLASRTIRKEG